MRGSADILGRKIKETNFLGGKSDGNVDNSRSTKFLFIQTASEGENRTEFFFSAKEKKEKRDRACGVEKFDKFFLGVEILCRVGGSIFFFLPFQNPSLSSLSMERKGESFSSIFTCVFMFA